MQEGSDRMKTVQFRIAYLLIALGLAALLTGVATDERRKRVERASRGTQTHNEAFLTGDGKNVDQQKDSVKRLFQAAATGDNTAIEALVQSGLSVNSRDEKRRTPLFYAAANYKDNPSTVALLVRLGADVNAMDDLGNTSLLLAMDPGGTLANVNALLKAGADPNVANFGGETPLMIASDWASPRHMALLLEKRADPNRRRVTDGKTALMFASHSGKPESVRILLRNGADPLLEDSSGRTALMLAEADYLKNKGTMNRYMRTGTANIINLLKRAARTKRVR
jgi:ankyrin repeat protein